MAFVAAAMIDGDPSLQDKSESIQDKSGSIQDQANRRLDFLARTITFLYKLFSISAFVWFNWNFYGVWYPIIMTHLGLIGLFMALEVTVFEKDII